MIASEVFKPVSHESLAEAVVARIETMIIDGVLKEGVRLPPERDMAEVLGVSRPKLREALEILEGRNLVVVRHGDGTYVGELSGRAMSPALLALYSRHSEAFFDYLEYRREQEGFAARLAAERATAADLERLDAIAEDLKQSWADDDPEAAREADSLLHSAIVDASHNTTLIHMMASVYDLTRRGIFYNRDFLHTIDGSGRLLLDQHLAIIDAIKDRAPERAEKASHDHLDFVEASFRLGQQQQRREERARARLKAST